MTPFSSLSRRVDDALIRPLRADDRFELESMISRDPVSYLFAAEHLHQLGLPTSSTLRQVKAPYGFVGVFMPPDEPLGAQEGQPLQVSEPLRARRLNPQGLARRFKEVAADASWWALGRVGRAEGAHFADSQLSGPSSLPGSAEVLAGSLEPPPAPSYRLVGAFWLGAYCFPLDLPAAYHRQVAAYIWRHQRRLGSIFGQQEAVMGLWSHLAGRMPTPFDVRANQPLMYLDPSYQLSSLAAADLARPHLDAPPLLGPTRWARTDDRASLLRASVAMFREEVGYDPMTRDPASYRRRVDDLIRTGRSLVAVNRENLVVFKVDVGLAHGSAGQLQGVWLHPAYRGQGLAPILLAQAVELIRSRFPELSLYVNDYNLKARSLYEGGGWQQVGTFASILF